MLINQIDKHYIKFGTPRHTAPTPDRTDEIESLSSIVLLRRVCYPRVSLIPSMLSVLQES